MPIDSGNLALKGLDDLFSTEENRQEEQREQVQQIPIDALHPFTNHPFKVLDDEAMTRTVESIATFFGKIQACEGYTDIFIYPGYRFKVLDGLITNFHLPESTLIMLVSALAGREHVLSAYKEAVEQRYRFFSFGDAMFIH